MLRTKGYRTFAALVEYWGILTWCVKHMMLKESSGYRTRRKGCRALQKQLLNLGKCCFLGLQAVEGISW
jgi:hypothetical protein